MFDIERFIEAQNSCDSYETALQEVKDGYKRSHWIWYIFPQMSGLGESHMSRKYAIGSLLEAKAYWENPVLHQRLVEITQALYRHNGRLPMEQVLGGIDAVKVRSCMTLFDYVAPDYIFMETLRDCFDGEYCEATRERMDKECAWLRRSAFTENGLHVDARSFLDTCCYESDQYTEEQKIGTLIEMFVRGERMEQIVSFYMWNRDTSDYRMRGVVCALKLYIMDMAFCLVRCGMKDYLVQLGVKLDILDDMEALEIARHFDSLMYEFTKNPDVMKAFEKFTEKSMLK